TEQLLDQSRREIGTLLARLADERLHAGARQQHPDPKARCLRANHPKRRQRCGREAGVEHAAADGHDSLSLRRNFYNSIETPMLARADHIGSLLRPKKLREA